MTDGGLYTVAFRETVSDDCEVQTSVSGGSVAFLIRMLSTRCATDVAHQRAIVDAANEALASQKDWIPCRIGVRCFGSVRVQPYEQQ